MTRVAVVGVGMMGERHARVVAHSQRAKLAYVADPDEAVGRGVAERYGTVWRPEFDGDVDAVVIAAPTPQHPELALAAIAAGVPVLVEKPLAAGLAATMDVLETAEAAGVVVMCGLVERFNPAVMTVRSLVDSPAHVVSVRELPHYAHIQTGVAWDLLIHQADMAVSLFGREPMSAVSSVGRFHPASSAEDVASMLLDFAPGVASLSAMKVSPAKAWTLHVHEVGRTIVADLVNWSVTVHLRDMSMQWDLVSRREPLAAQLDHFLDLVDGSGDPAVERASILAAHRTVARAT